MSISFGFFGPPCIGDQHYSRRFLIRLAPKSRPRTDGLMREGSSY